MLRRTPNLASLAARRIPSTSSTRCLSSTAKRQSDITLEVDGVSVTVPQGTALIQACEKAGTFIKLSFYEITIPLDPIGGKPSTLHLAMLRGGLQSHASSRRLQHGFDREAASARWRISEGEPKRARGNQRNTLARSLGRHGISRRSIESLRKTRSEGGKMDSGLSTRIAEQAKDRICSTSLERTSSNSR